jgi:hypothetical protein
MADFTKLEKAIKERDAAVEEFYALCKEGRESPVSIKEFVKNNIRYKKAVEAVYEAMFYGQAGTGVQILRVNGDITDLKITPKPK